MTRLINEDARKLKIKQCIRSHDEYGPEEVLREVGDSMSRRTFYRLLGELKADKEVISEFRNKRDQKLYLNGQNTLLIVSGNLDRFEYLFFKLLDNVIKELEKPYSSIEERANMIEEQFNRIIIPSPDSHLNLFKYTIFVFHHAVTQWLFDVSFTLPEKVKDPKYLERINGLILTRVSGMYSKLFEKISSLTDRRHLKVQFNKKIVKDTKDYVYQELNGIFETAFGEDGPTETFEFFDVDKEAAELYWFKLI